MSSKRQQFKFIKKVFKLNQHFFSAIKKQLNWILRSLFLSKRRQSAVNAGFVLPTVAMVALVVVLLTTAILFRSFERAKNASNVRVNEVVLNAATPAIDRARAKINKLFQDGRLPRATPTDDALYSTLTTNLAEYTFGDETTLTLTNASSELKTGWRYPVDTDNNGKFDSYTVYGIYFKNPPISNGQYTRARNSLEARTPPMTVGTTSGDCGDTLGTSATLVGSTGWFKVGNKLKKAFFVYTATVPITTTPTDTTNYEIYKGSKGFSALEYQQDRVQLPLVNNAVVYEDDVEITPGPPLRLNGRIFTNSNLLTGGGSVTLYQVSSKASCFYDEENAKIIVGGNLGFGGFTDTADDSSSTKVDLYRKGETTDPVQVSFVKSVTAVPKDVAYNSLAYVQRINRLVSAQIANDSTTDPQEVKNGITEEKTKLGLASYTTDEEAKLRRQQLELYFKKRTRRVPYTEVAFADDALGTYATTTPLQGSGDTLRPIDAWIYPTDPTDGKTGTDYTKLTLNINSTKLIPSATEPDYLAKDLQGKEQYLGDRVIVGNNLPQRWWDSTKSRFVGPNAQDTQNLSSLVWDRPTGSAAKTRTRRSRVETLADLGSIDRDKDWELAAAKVPTSPQDPVGGLRVVTGAGIYLPTSYTAASTDFSTASKQIWSDMMPVAGGASSNLPYLRMRATAVYHYKATSYDEKQPKPIACVSSYYDPTNSTTARNQSSLADVSPADSYLQGSNAGNSNNGIAYGPPTKAVSNYENLLNYQADLTYQNGRSIDDGLLKKALAKTAANRTIAEQSRIDAALCALQILDGSVTASTSVIPNGAIMEAAFLDARQIKAIYSSDPSKPGAQGELFTGATNGTDYNLATKDRQPLEVRVTVLDIQKLRTTASPNPGSSPSQEYLLPNSGIVYASRDDALPDLTASATGGSEAQKAESPVDFKLDPTRRPNGIMLINGSKIWRVSTYRDLEKGLILATNLPVYVKGDFNLHTQQEFTENLLDDWSNFYTRSADNRNTNFACRANDPRLPNCKTGDEWRPAAVLADSITLLSNNFRMGFRNEGDYDLNDNLGSPTSIADRKKKALGINYYVNSYKWYDETTGLPKDFEATVTIPQADGSTKSIYDGVQGSSYLNNFVTPIQRKARTREYATEVCTAANIDDCNDPKNWIIKVTTGSGSFTQWDKVGNSNGIIGQPVSSLKTGTVSPEKPPVDEFAGKPTRMAFQRDPDTGELLKDSTGNYIPYGVKNGKLDVFPYSTWSSKKPDFATTGTGGSTTQIMVPWFKSYNPTTGTVSFKDDQPPLITMENGVASMVPVFQFDLPFGTATSPEESKSVAAGQHNNWLQIATETTFNLISATGDTPARPTEDNGGLHNFVRFVENWNPTGTVSDAIKARISGAFMQIKRSAYADAPLMSVLTAQYKIQNNNGTIPFYLAPTRQWGYDVALLSQSPDLFAQKLVTLPDDLPDEYFREVSRDDNWVTSLLCAKTTASGTPYAIDKDQRPASCQS